MQPNMTLGNSFMVSTYTSSRQNESALRSVVFKALDHKIVFSTVSKLSTIINNELISPVMITRLVVPTPEFESTIKNGLKAGIYTEEPIEFTDLRQAFSAIDQETTWELTIKAGLETISRPLLNQSGLSLKEFLRHSFATAAGCASIAEFLDLPKHQFIVAGLFHNIGIPVLANSFPDSYKTFQNVLPGSSTFLEDLERNEFGFTHEDAGAVFLMAATSPDNSWKSASNHHSPDETNDLITASVRVCSNVAHQVGCTLGFANACNKLHPSLIPGIGLTDHALSKIASAMATASNQASKIT